MIDTHAHLYSTQYEGQNEEMIKRALAAGVTKIFMPNIDTESLEPMLALAQTFPNVCYPMIGLHPCDVDAEYLSKLTQLKNQLSSHSFCAIGEIGMDLFHDVTYKEQQEDAFKIQLQWATEHKLPINIHSRQANNETISILKNYNDSFIKGVFHCFSGTIEQANAVVSMDFLLGIGGVVTFKNSGLDMIVKEIPLSHLVLETDAPYLAPVPYRGKRNEPAYLGLIADKIAEIKGITSEEVKNITTDNALRIFNISK